MTEVAAGRIQVRRVKAGFFERDRLRSYDVMIDEQRWAQVRRGKTVVVDVPAGPHDVRVKIDWTGSPALHVEVKPGEQINLVAVPKGVTIAPIPDLVSTDHWVTLHLDPEPST
jgi:hypothetical protein